MSIFIRALFLTSFLFNISCKKSITEPEKPASWKKYVWEVDTINFDRRGFVAVRFWGVNSKDLWISALGDFLNNLWHYNGEKVSRDSILRPILSPCGIYGFSADDIWLASSDFEMWHYDGIKWSKFGTYKRKHYSRMSIENIWGRSRDDVYGVGVAYDERDAIGVILHFDGNEWNFVEIQDIHATFIDIRFSQSTNTYFIQALTNSVSDTTIFYSLKGNIISEKLVTTEYASLNNLGNEVYFLIDNTIYDSNLSTWKKITSQYNLSRMYGRDLNDIYFTTTVGIGNFNGNTFKIIYPTVDWCYEGLLFSKDVFFLGLNLDTYKNILIHGEIKE